MTEITTNQLEQILDLLGEGNERVADAREMLQRITTPKTKPADMSVFIDQPALCEFWDCGGDQTALGMLESFFGEADDMQFADHNSSRWHYAQPKFGYWQSKLNVDGDFGDFWLKVSAAGFRIKGEGNSFRITGYRDGFGPEWECEQ